MLLGDDVGEFKMMCVHGYSSVVQNAVKLDEKLGAASKQPPPDGLYDKSFFGKYCYYCVHNLYCLFDRSSVLYLHFWDYWTTQTCHYKTQQVNLTSYMVIDNPHKTAKL